MAAEYKDRVGSRIRTAREDKRWSQHELARHLPGTIGGDQIGRWERGEVMPRPGTLEALADALSVDVSYFLVEAPTVESANDDLADAAALALLEQIDRKLTILLEHVRRQDGGDPLQLAEALRDLPGKDTPPAERPAAAAPPARRRRSA